MLLTALSGKTLDPANPQPSDFNIRDIAHALDQICRFSGQLAEPYSVAAHSLRVADLVAYQGGTPLEVLTALLHDASEAYLQDLPTPVKNLCLDYKAIEESFQEKLAIYFGTLYPIPEIVERADKEALVIEKIYQRLRDKKLLSYVGRKCEKEFLRLFKELGGFKQMKLATQRRLDAEAQKENDEALEIETEQVNLSPSEASKLMKETVCGKPKKRKRRKKRS